MTRMTVSVVLVIALASCAGDDDWGGKNPSFTAHGVRVMRGDPTGTAAGLKQLQECDTNKDGVVTRAELEARLKSDFAKADADHNGILDAGEAQNENTRRYAASGTQYSPLLDWNQDGVIDYGEFAGAMRSLFDQLDTDHDGELSGSELRPPRAPVLEEPPKVNPPSGHG